jgi:hypothetical protein
MREGRGTRGETLRREGRENRKKKEEVGNRRQRGERRRDRI